MTMFHISQGERWHRVYQVEADTIEEAREKYERLRAKYGLEINRLIVEDPQYIDDIEDDVEVYEVDT